MPDSSMDALMQKAYGKVQGEMPTVKGGTLSASDSSVLPGIFMPRGADAVTNPFSGNITYNPDAMASRSPFDREQILTHELTHAGQTQDTPWWKTLAGIVSPDERVPQGVQPGSPFNNPYYWRPRELEAYQAERDRARMVPDVADPISGARDIPLPAPRKPR
jgi:hypothetical protein